jgi:aminoglycoside phosphotransferase (APT) family kinase protein
MTDVNPDVEVLRARIQRASTGRVPGDVVALQPLEGGRSGITYRVAFRTPDDERTQAVVRVAPAGIPPVKNRDVLRQARLLRALRANTTVPVPSVLFEDGGDPPAVPPFFAAEHVAGECVETGSSYPATVLDPSIIGARALGAAAVLGDLHSVGWASLGLPDEPIRSPTDEVEQWRRVLGATDPALDASSSECARRLASSAPRALTAAIVHGDYRLGNILCEGTRAMAVIDWEIWSRGDPRIDVAYFLAVTCGDDVLKATDDVQGVPTREVLLAAYRGRRPSDAVDDLSWFEGLTAFRQAAIMAQVVKFAASRPTREPPLPGMHDSPVRYLERCLCLLDARSASSA